MICPGCQRANEDNAEHCFYCGRALDALTQGVLLSGRYEVLRPVGKGGMGRVYKARDKALEEDVAIKVLRQELVRDPEMARRFKSEIKLARKVSHPNVCRIHDYGEDQGLLFISMEFIDGPGLKQRLATAPTVDEAFEIVLQIARGLQAVHAHGIIHRDFKASNIMVDSRGVVKLMDFGIAKDALADTTGFTREGQVIGTPEYMSPEQAGGRKVDFRSDIYSMGCVVFEIFSGEAPFKGSSPLATLYKHAREELRLDHPALPASLKPVLAKALAKDPEQRYSTVAELVEALEQARAAISPEEARTVLARPKRAPAPPTSTIDGSLELLPPSGPPPTPATPTPPTRRRGDRIWPVALVGLAIVVGVAFFLRDDAQQAVPAPPLPSLRPRPAASAAPATTAPTAPTPAASLEPTSAPRTTPSLRAPTAISTHVPATTLAAPPPTPPTPAPSERPAATPTPAPSPTHAAATPAPAPEKGGLKLIVSPAAEVQLNGSSLGSVSLRELTLAPGRHVVRILHPEYEPLQRVVTVRAGIESQLVIDLREKGIRKSR
jgi:serine/threonine-protein kinase